MNTTFNIVVRDGSWENPVGCLFVGERARGDVGDSFGWRRFVSGVDFMHKCAQPEGPPDFVRVSTYVPDGPERTPWPPAVVSAVTGITPEFPDSGGDPIPDSLMVRVNPDSGGTLAVIRATMDTEPNHPTPAHFANTYTKWNVVVTGVRGVPPFVIYLNAGDRWLQFLNLVFARIASTHHQYTDQYLSSYRGGTG